MRFLFVDRILDLTPGRFVRGVKHVTADDFYLTCDENGRACFISSLIGETLGQLAAWNVMVDNDFTHRPVAGIVSCAQLHRPVYVGETILLESYIDSIDESAVCYHSVASVGEEEVFRIDNALGPLLPMQEFIEDAVVRRQFAEIYRPGDFALANASDKDELSTLTTEARSQSHVQFDSILSFIPGEEVTAQKRLTRAAPYFADHFPNKPVLPMTILLECKLNLARWFLKNSQFAIPYRIQELRKIKMNEFVQPGDVLTCQVSVKRRDDKQLVLNYRSEVDGKRVCVLDVVLAARNVA